MGYQFEIVKMEDGSRYFVWTEEPGSLLKASRLDGVDKFILLSAKHVADVEDVDDLNFIGLVKGWSKEAREAAIEARRGAGKGGKKGGEGSTQPSGKLSAKDYEVVGRKLKLPGGEGAKYTDEGYTWFKQGGSGDAVHRRVTSTLRADGWKQGESNPHGNASGSHVGNSIEYRKDGLVLRVSSSYGVTGRNNWHRITLNTEE